MARTDIEDAFSSLRHLIKTATPGAVKAAQKAAGDVYVRAAKQAVPVKSGRLKQSIKIIQGRPDHYGNRHLYVSPDKKTGYYGYFLEKAHRAHLRAFNGRVHSKRLARKGNKVTHSQSGESEPTHIIPARPWLEPAIKGIEAEAQRAAEEAFCLVISSKDI